MSQQGLFYTMSHDFHTPDTIFLAFVGQSVRNYRLYRELSIEDLSSISGISPIIISRIENGSEDIYLNDLSIIAKSLDVAAADLVDIPQQSL